MEIHWAQGVVRLERAEDFKAFKVVVEGGATRWPEVERAFAGLARFEGRETAWVSQAGLVGLAGTVAQGAWREEMDRMVAKARPFGWIDEATGDIRAHVECT